MIDGITTNWFGLALMAALIMPAFVRWTAALLCLVIDGLAEVTRKWEATFPAKLSLDWKGPYPPPNILMVDGKEYRQTVVGPPEPPPDREIKKGGE